MELAGTWRAAPAEEALRRAFPAVEFHGEGWEAVEVPGHWRTTPAFAESDGPLLYRRAFEAAAPGEGRRSWLTLDGVFYDGDVWLDGGYVGATEGYFFPHTFEVTDALKERSEHLLAIEVGCSPPGDLTSKRALTGAFQHSEFVDPTWNPGGIWRPVGVTETGPVRVSRLRVLCVEATAERAVLDVRAVLDAAATTSALLKVTVSLVGGAVVAELLTRHPLASGENRIRLPVPIESPALWWPHALGAQPLHDVTVHVLVPEDDAVPVRARRGRRTGQAIDAGEADGHVPSDVRRVRTGLRQVRMSNWIMTVNGERLFLKGTSQGPARMALATATAGELERDVARAKEAGLDLVRVHSHVTRPEFYEAADRLGMLLWQDLPLHRGYARSVRKQAMRQAREAVDLLGQHPSIAMWCAHNEPLNLDSPEVPAPARYVALQEVPTWNKTVLDSSIGRALERADQSRPVIRHSGMLPGPVSAGTDSHLYLGWYHGSERDLPRLLATMPRLARFVGEFGAQAVPESASWMEPDRWPSLDWADLAERHGLQPGAFEKHVPPSAYGSFSAWRDATQAYQATVIRYQVEALRLLKYRPTGGFCQFMLADAHPAVSFSVLDDQRVAKAGYAALAAACAPVVVILERPDESYPAGAEIALDVHVVSDLRRPLPGARVVARMGAETWGWDGDLEADSCVRVGRIVTTAPRVATTLVLTLDAGDVHTSSSYPVEVATA